MQSSFEQTLEYLGWTRIPGPSSWMVVFTRGLALISSSLMSLAHPCPSSRFSSSISFPGVCTSPQCAAKVSMSPVSLSLSSDIYMSVRLGVSGDLPSLSCSPSLLLFLPFLNSVKSPSRLSDVLSVWTESGSLVFVCCSVASFRLYFFSCLTFL